MLQRAVAIRPPSLKWRLRSLTRVGLAMASLELSRRNYLILCVLLAAFVSAWLAFTHGEIRRQVLNDVRDSLQSQLMLRRSLLQKQLQDGLHHADFLYRTPPIEGIVRASQNQGIDPLENTPYEVWVRRLQIIFKAYIATNSNIKQARFIGVADGGRELVRVQRTSGSIDVVPPQHLQQKGGREYFIATSRLARDETYVSDINLNREFGKVEQPSWPTYRVAKPIYDESAALFGILIINFDVTGLLESLQAVESQNFLMFLLNQNGQYLVHPKKDEEFAWEYDKNKGWFADSNYTQHSLAGHFTRLSHTGLGITTWVLADEVAFKFSNNNAALTLILGRDESEINRVILRRQITNTALDFTLGLIIYLLLYLFYRLSEKTRAENQLRAEIQAVFNGTNNAILSINRRSEIRSWNSAALSIFDIDTSKIRGMHLLQLPALRRHHETLQRTLAALWSAGSHAMIELKVQVEKKAPVDLSLSLSPIQNTTGGFSGAALLFHDISEAKRLQTKLEQLNERLEDRNAEMEKFIYSVSHDLKAPLVTISSFTEKIIKTAADALDEKNRHRLNRILINAQNMAEVLKELLDLSKIAREELNTSLCRIADCVENACSALNQHIVEASASFTIDENDALVNCNGKLVTTCLQNLIGNAIQYRDPARDLRITVKTMLKNDVARISVSDNGLGIDAKYHAQIFKIFERLDQGDGNGVGLAIVKSIIEKHGGWVELESELGMGSKFTLCIPQTGLEQ